MRVSKDQQLKNRARVVDAAARLMRKRGVAEIGVDALARAAGMTHGAIYSQFADKDDLAAAAIEHALASERQRWREDAAAVGEPGSPEYFGELVRQYVSRAHRDHPEKGCALAALGSEAMRRGKKVREAFANHAEIMIADFAAASGERDPEAAKDAAMVTVAAMVGSIVLARAIGDRDLSDRVLLAVRRNLMANVSQQRGRKPARAAKRP
jgi:TetR/AcrR family transcriptional repressor of nem operon